MGTELIIIVVVGVIALIALLALPIQTQPEGTTIIIQPAPPAAGGDLVSIVVGLAIMGGLILALLNA